MKMLRNVLLSLLVISALSACGGFVEKPIITRPATLILPEMPTDGALSCLPVPVFSAVIERDSMLFNRVNTLEGQIDAHNE